MAVFYSWLLWVGQSYKAFQWTFATCEVESTEKSLIITPAGGYAEPFSKRPPVLDTHGSTLGCQNSMELQHLLFCYNQECSLCFKALCVVSLTAKMPYFSLGQGCPAWFGDFSNQTHLLNQAVPGSTGLRYSTWTQNLDNVDIFSIKRAEFARNHLPPPTPPENPFQQSSQ